MTFKQFLDNPDKYKGGYVPKINNILNQPPLINESFEYIKDLLQKLCEFESEAEYNEYLSGLVISRLSPQKSLYCYDMNDILDYILYFDNEIFEIKQMENELQTKVPRPNIEAFIQQLNFEGFSYFPQLYDLTDGDVTKYKDVLSQPYIVCYQYLLYKAKLNDLEYLINSQPAK